jgi:uncharacterized protein with LGFP repeats
VGQPAGVPIAPDALLGADGRSARRAPASAPVLRVVAGTARFSAIGVSWAEQPDVGAVSVAVRARRASGEWSGWLTASTEESAVEPGANRHPQRGGAELIWTGPADGAEVVVTGLAGAAPRDLRADLIDPGRGRVSVAPPPRLRAAGRVPAPAIRSRAQWGADESKMTWRAEYASTLRAAVLHHTATTNDYQPADVPGIMRSIYRFQAVTRGWGDIGYNVLVDRFGQAWEGRAGGLSRPVVGAHAGGFNTGTFGISMIGDFTGMAPPAVTLETVARALAWKFAAYGIDPRGTTRITGGPSTRYKTRVTITVPVLYPHKLTSITACPGRYGEAALAGLRVRTAALIANPSAPISPSPTPSPAPAPPPSPTAEPTPTADPTLTPEPPPTTEPTPTTGSRS